MSSNGHRRLSPNGIDASTGKPLLSATLEEIAAIACGEDLPAGEAEERRRQAARLREEHLDVRFGADLRDLAECGWGVIFPKNKKRQDELREALAPLLALRRSQAALLRESRYREAVALRGELKAQFLARYGMGPGPADPDRLPYYLLIAGNPDEIPFRFQYRLDMEYAVGRVCFPTMEEYARYAESVVAAERGALRASRRACFFGVANPDDPTTALCLRDLVRPLAARIARDRRDWTVETVLGPAATKAALADRLGGPQTPALLFTSSHGVGFRPADPRHRLHQGALLCQDWPGPEAWQDRIPQDFYLAADDVADSASPAGLIAFLFACYGAGTPRYDSFERNGTQRQIAARSFVARLPQRLLGHPRGGALAVVGHVDRAWTFSFDWPQSGAQLQVFESALGRLLAGYPVGAAMEYFNHRYSEISTDLFEERQQIRWGAKPDFLGISDLWTAANDSRCYVVLGDPAVRLAPSVGAEE
jgi:hypothetical protein